MRTEHLDQASFCPFAPREVSVLAELALGHLRYSLTDVPPQSNSPPGSVLEPDHAGVYDGDAPGHPSTSPLCTLGTKHRAPADVSRPRTASAQPSKYRADRTRALRFTETTTSPGQTRGLAAGKIRGRPERGSGFRRAHDERTRASTAGRVRFPSEPDAPRSSEPILIPKLRIQFADFPYLHYSIDQRLFTLETCCGYGYEPARHLRVRPSPEFSRIPWNSNAQAEKKTLPGPLGGVFRPLWVTPSNSRALSRRGNDYRNGSAAGFRNRNRIPFRSTGDRLTREQLLFTRNPSPRQSSRASLEYLLLPPRSAPTEAPGGLTPRPFCALRRARPTRYGLMTARFKRAVARAGNGIVHHLSGPSICARSAPSSADWERDASGVRDADRDPRPSSPSVPKKIETPLHFRYAFQFDRYTRGDSTTRTHARLLGPCYKTGPASARNRIIADGYAHGQRLHGGRIDAGAQRRGPHSGGTSNATTPRVGPDAPKRVRVSYSYRPIGRPVGHRRGPTTELRSPGSRTALRPTSNGSRCLTEREVHAVPGDDTHDPRPPTRPRKTEIDGRPGRPYARSTETNVESLRSFIRVSQGCTLKQPDSEESPLAAALRLYGPGTLYGKAAPFKTNLDRRPDDEKAEPPEHHMSRDRYDRAIRRWALSCSLAATKEILTRYPSARRRARVESAYGGYIVTKNFKILRRAHRTRRIIDPSFRLRHRTPLRGVGSLPRREYEDDARDVCVCAAA
ncbi:Putative uncharacterized protein ART2 [Eumeta japonica]|uniref:Uncharacterized protein n=1 Tax=Eumeta variegata TaxID=151549 RepID=A0A4C1WQW8_EUMVA|nr:Putative uncharacterized protein ART2 [Eumeta japonica]